MRIKSKLEGVGLGSVERVNGRRVGSRKGEMKMGRGQRKSFVCLGH